MVIRPVRLIVTSAFRRSIIARKVFDKAVALLLDVREVDAQFVPLAFQPASKLNRNIASRDICKYPELSIGFRRIGRRDATRAEKNFTLSLISLRLREMTPTSRDRILNGHGITDTVHWLICISEILAEAGFQKTANGVKSLSDDMAISPCYDQPPTPEQKERGEQSKREWERRIKELRK